MKKKEKIPASIPLAEFNKEIAQECREKAKNLIEWADIIEGKMPTNDKYELLKEFTEWYKERLQHIQGHEKELLDDDVKHEYSYLVEYRKGTTDMIDRLISWLDNDLKRFLGERK